MLRVFNLVILTASVISSCRPHLTPVQHRQAALPQKRACVKMANIVSLIFAILGAISWIITLGGLVSSWEGRRRLMPRPGSLVGAC